MDATLYTIHAYSPDKPGTEVVGQVYGKREANEFLKLMRDTYPHLKFKMGVG